MAEIDADNRGGGKKKRGRVYLQSRLKHMRGLAVSAMSGVELEFAWHLSHSTVWGRVEAPLANALGVLTCTDQYHRTQYDNNLKQDSKREQTSTLLANSES